jgi:hypothetical protein
MKTVPSPLERGDRREAMVGEVLSFNIRNVRTTHGQTLRTQLYPA